ncbi:MAG: rhodanese-like domain-containing protein [Desulfobacterales bacterium]|jgi:rhodanese-related sulfurtransferase/rubrerythrin|nr:rhodanese-like domain-containing protein [Desulfobacterales bacterium]
MKDEKIKAMWPEELKEYMQREREEDYLLVDVRQPQEYEVEHIPGALLIPLPQVMKDVTRVPVNKNLIFYCAHGIRSRVAAERCADSGRHPHAIYSLTGGIAAWEAQVVTDVPKLEIFNDLSAPTDWVKTAMNLEKGAFLFYDYVIKKCTDTDLVKALVDISVMETAHARLIYNLFPRDERSTEMFQDVYGALSGDIVEGGQPLSELCRQLEAMPGPFMTNALEMALRIEYAAYDLYRSLADQSEDERIQKALLNLSQAEKKHVDRVARLFENAF